MGQFNLDRYFKKRIESHSEEMDTDVLWDALDLEKDKKDRPIIFWLVGLIPLLFAVGFSLYFLGQEGEAAQPSSIVVEDFGASTNTMKNLKGSKELVLDSKQTPADKINGTENLESRKSNIKKPNIKPANDSSSRIVSTNTKTPLTIKKAQSSDAYLIPSEENQDSGDDSLNDAAIQSNEVIVLSNPKNIEGSGMLSLTTDQQNKSLAINHIPLLLAGSFENKSRLDVGPNSLLFPELNFQVERSSLPSLERGNHFDLNVYGGYSYIERSLTSNNSETTAEFNQLRNESETLLEAISVGADLRHKTKSGFYAKLGLEYLSINERFNWSITEEEEVVTEDLIRITYVSAQGDTTLTTGQGLGVQPTTKTWVNYNNHRMLSVPLSLGYEYSTGPWSFFVEGSYHLNLNYDFNGRQLNDGDEVTTEPQYMNPGAKHSFALSTGIAYQVKSKMNLFVQPQFQSFLSSFTKEGEFDMEQKYMLYGLKAGVSYLLR